MDSSERWESAKQLLKTGPKPGEVYLHSNGQKYVVTGRSINHVDYAQLVTYCHETNKSDHFTRTVEEFEKKFVKAQETDVQQAAKKGFNS